MDCRARRKSDFAEFAEVSRRAFMGFVLRVDARPVFTAGPNLGLLSVIDQTTFTIQKRARVRARSHDREDGVEAGWRHCRAPRSRPTGRCG